MNALFNILVMVGSIILDGINYQIIPVVETDGTASKTLCLIGKDDGGNVEMLEARVMNRTAPAGRVQGALICNKVGQKARKVHWIDKEYSVNFTGE